MVKMLVNQYGYAQKFDDDDIVAIGVDPNGIRRCFGYSANSSEEADKECWAEVLEYVKRRPDSGPVAAWHIEYE